MPRICTICGSPGREKIEAEIVAGGSLRGIASKYGVSADALARHKVHVGQSIVKAAERHGEKIGDSLLNQIRALTSRAWLLLDKLEKQGDLRGAVVALGQTRETLTSLSTLLAEATAQSHPSPCPHCDHEEYRRKCLEAVKASLGVDSSLPALPEAERNDP